MENVKTKNDFEYIVDRIDHGLVAFGSIELDINKPTILPGDIVAIRKSEGYAPGNFIFYENANNYYIRRIIKAEYNKVYVKGDNENNVFLILPEQILGKAISLERGIKRISLVVIRNRLKLRRIINQGLKYIKDNFVENDQYIMPVVETTKKKKKETKPVLPLTNDLQNQLAQFKSVDKKVEEFYNLEPEEDEE